MTPGDSNVSVETKIGSIRGLPNALLGWIATAAIAGFLVWNLATGVDYKLARMIESQNNAVRAMERLVDRMEKCFSAGGK